MPSRSVIQVSMVSKHSTETQPIQVINKLLSLVVMEAVIFKVLLGRGRNFQVNGLRTVISATIIVQIFSFPFLPMDTFIILESLGLYGTQLENLKHRLWASTRPL